MVRVTGVILPQQKHISIALLDIFGVGKTRSKKICEKLNLDPTTKVRDIDDSMASAIQDAVNEYEVEGDLRRRIGMNIKRLVDIKAYRGLRHRRGLPVRGQRTKTNAATRKGRKGKRQAGSSAGKGKK